MDYRTEQEKTRKRSILTGVSVTVGVHLALAVVFMFTGLTYIYPPPEELGIEVTFEESEPRPIEIARQFSDNQPRSPKSDPDNEVKLSQKAESPYEGTKQNVAEEAVNDDFGDVETPDPRPQEEKEEIDKRALFPSADNKAKQDTLAAQTASKVTQAMKAGHSQGNTDDPNADSDGPKAKLEGRHVNSLPKPQYTVQAEGKITVVILVDRNGAVTSAQIGTPTTINSRELQQAAIEAAKKAHFSSSSAAPIKQQGTITYIFKLK